MVASPLGRPLMSILSLFYLSGVSRVTYFIERTVCVPKFFLLSVSIRERKRKKTEIVVALRPTVRKLGSDAQRKKEGEEKNTPMILFL